MAALQSSLYGRRSLDGYGLPGETRAEDDYKLLWTTRMKQPAISESGDRR
ncbi:MAG: hypothetical protein ABSG96_23625 [Terracidiphilus sp.]